MWALWSPRQIVDHYPDCERRERRKWMILQRMVIHRAEFEETEWDWLDELEDRLWGDGTISREKSKPKTQREMLAELREQGLKKLREEQEQGVQSDGSAGSFTGIR